MKKMQRRIIKLSLTLALFLVIVFLAGCSFGSQAVKNYPQFLDIKDKINSISVFADVIIFYDGVEKGQIVDLPLSLDAGDAILASIKRELEIRNYPVGDIHAPAVGYSPKHEDREYRVFETTADYKLPTDSLYKMYPPFFLDETFDTTIFSMLPPEEETSAALAGNNYMLIVYVEASNVSFTKKFAEDFLSSIIWGKYADPIESTAYAEYMIVDRHTGEVVFFDAKYFEGSNLDESNVGGFMSRLMEGIPVKN